VKPCVFQLLPRGPAYSEELLGAFSKEAPLSRVLSHQACCEGCFGLCPISPVLAPKSIETGVTAEASPQGNRHFFNLANEFSNKLRHSIDLPSKN